MEKLGAVNHRDVYYLSSSWSDEGADFLATRNWVLFVVADQHDETLFEKVAAEALQYSPLYVCSTGATEIHLDTAFDEEIVRLAVDWEVSHQQQFDYGQAAVTVSMPDVAEAFWFTTSVAQHSRKGMDVVLCLDLAGTYKARIIELISLINNGWSPPDFDFEAGTTVRIL
ncbi:hypothetical protein [Hymenobacter latericus]|uniref:hypothetical protein n=1 Tax=Hymenobacter sp. YIM 151858-1 TaxID=2987688 RepID=UPI002225ECFD|nr:hypothetical protein [Hymenobacter sp. YIM 151858-1]UYZ59206.1 hypothetical protein OIS50_00030 [Hymenobacter sp. YIM 151858-1]